MKRSIKSLLESSLLEEYALGLLDPAETAQVEKALREHPEVRKAYQELQEGLEDLARQSGITPPPGTKEGLINRLEQGRPTKQPMLIWRRTGALAAAVIIALSIGLWIVQLAGERRSVRRQVSDLQEQVIQLESALAEQQKAYADQQAEWDLLADPQTRRIPLFGNQQAPQFQAVAFWNASAEAGRLRILELPVLPPDKCLQMWADVDGEMVNLGILPADQGTWITLPFRPRATSLNVTVEPQGGSDHPTVSDLVANSSI